MNISSVAATDGRTLTEKPSADPKNIRVHNSRISPDALHLCSLSDEIRAQFILQDRLLVYPAYQTVITQATWLMHETRQTRARGIIIPGEAGNGKSSIANLLYDRYKFDPNRPAPCAIRVSLSGARDSRTVYGRILESLGSPAKISHRLSDREALVHRLLAQIDCRLLLVDETQDILLGTEREQQKALEGIKYLMNERRLPVMAFGTENAKLAFLSDMHLEARFKTIIPLPRWEADDVLADFLASYEKYLPLRRESNLDARLMVGTVIELSQGVLSNIVSLLQNAALWAIHEKSERITAGLLHKAIGRPEVCWLPRPQCEVLQ